MAVRKILSTADPRLRQVSKPVARADKKLASLLRDLKNTLKAQKDPEGIGLAAPQIGVFQRVFIVQTTKHGLLTFVNSEIVKISKTTNEPKEKQKNKKTEEQKNYILEGCLSLPHYYGPVQRAASVTVKYQVPQMINDKWQMKNVQKSFQGFVAQILQHEIDHLNGKVFTERLLEQKRKLYKAHGDHFHEVELP